MSRSWMATYLKPGGFVDPLNLDPEDILFGDIAHALSNLCRFNGHCREFYSVAQHSVFVADILAELGASITEQLFGLFHDGAEAYLGDMIRPLKKTWLLDAFRQHESKVQRMIYDKFCGPILYPSSEVEEADNAALYYEAFMLFGPRAESWQLAPPTCGPLGIPLPIPILPRAAAILFTDRFHDLSRALENFL